MNLNTYKPFQSLKNWRFVTGWTLELYDRVRHEGEVADRCLASFLRSNPQIGSRNRRALGDLLFNTLRWDLACDTLADRGVLDEPCRDAFRLAGGLILAMGQQAPALSELTQYLELSSQEQNALVTLTHLQKHDVDPIWTTGLSPFLIKELTDALDGEGFQQLAATLLRTGPIWLKTRAANETQEILNGLRQQGMDVETLPALPGTLRLSKRGPLQQHKAFRKGRFWIQDLGSQLISRLVAPAPNHRVLDACAGAGGKSLFLLSEYPKLDLSAWDVDARRLANLKKRLKRSQFRPIPVQSIQEEGKLPAAPGSFDRVLIDAPCSGSGTIGAHPEIRRRITAKRIAEETNRQGKILRRFAPLVRPGGRLIYATCSMLRAENEERITAFLEENKDFQLVPAAIVLGEEIATRFDQHLYLRLWPHRHGCDGFFAAVLQRSGEGSSTLK